MSNSWKLQLAWVNDGSLYTRRRAKTKSVMRPIDRRIKRREHTSITREAVDSWYADGRDTYYEYLDAHDWEFNEYSFWEPEYDEREDYEEEDYSYSYDPYDDYIYDGWASYHYGDGEDYWGNRPVAPEDKRFIEREDIGKSLGEILAEIRAKGD